jgi:DNA-binding response OmpR family regulator
MERMMKILVVEDEKTTAEHLKRLLHDSGYAVDCVSSGWEASEYLDTYPCDLVIMDAVLHGNNGLSVCSLLRQQGLPTPIMLISNSSNVSDRIKGLDSGVNDFVVKPFDDGEFSARVRSLLRRNTGANTPKLIYGDLVLDRINKRVYFKSEDLNLTPKEFAVLEYLMTYPEKVISGQELEQHIWEIDASIGSNTLEAHITRLRRKIRNYTDHEIISTVKGAGYRFECE